MRGEFSEQPPLECRKSRIYSSTPTRWGKNWFLVCDWCMPRDFNNFRARIRAKNMLRRCTDCNRSREQLFSTSAV